jgi:hypothetical protein
MTIPQTAIDNVQIRKIFYACTKCFTFPEVMSHKRDTVKMQSNPAAMQKSVFFGWMTEVHIYKSLFFE